MSEPLTCEVLNTLNEALCHEQEGVQFYEDAAKQAVNPDGRKMFLELAAEARQQIDVIQKQIKRLEAESDWDLPECVFSCQLDVNEPLFPREEKAKQEAIGPHMTELGALAVAMEKESNGYDLYARHSQGATDERATALYRYLASQAQRRFELMRLNYEDIANASGLA